jgi:hypothetical protein
MIAHGAEHSRLQIAKGYLVGKPLTSTSAL